MNKKSNIIPKNQQSFSSYKREQELINGQEKETKTGDAAYILWQNRVEQTLNWRRTNYWNGDKNWQNAYRMYKGKHWRESDTDDPSSGNPKDFITVNITGSTIQNIGPFLMNSKASFVLKPRQPESNVSAMIQQSVLNYEWEQRGMQQQVRKAVDDFMIIGHGICKTGFNLELDEAIRKADGDIVYADYIKEEAPFVKRINPHYFVFDPTASENNLDTARWCAEIFFVPIPDILANASYNQKVIKEIREQKYSIQTKISLYGSDSEVTTTEDQYLSTHNPDADLGVLYEIWDKKFKKYYVFAKGVVPPLVEKDWPYDYLNGFPYKMITFIPINDEPYGIGLPMMIQDQQYELNRKRTSLFQHTRRFNRKYQVLNTVSPESKTSLTDGEDGSLVEVDVMGSIEPINDAPLPPDVYQQEAIIKEDVRQLTGADALIQGGNLPSRTTAGEVNARSNIFRAKLDDRINSVDTFIVELARQVLAHIKANYLTDRITRIVGKTGEYWVRYSVQDIQDAVDVTMESIAAPKTDPLLDRQQALQILQISQGLLPLMQQGLLKINLNELFKWVLEKFDIKDAGRFFEDALIPNTPLQEKSTPIEGQQALPQQGGSQELFQPNSTEVNSVQDLQKQIGIAPISNASGLQI